MITIKFNKDSKKYRHSLIWIGNSTIENPSLTIGNFSNKTKALKLLRFLNWYQKKYGDFTDAYEASLRLANAASQLDINYISFI
jgi:hypothetical protein